MCFVLKFKSLLIFATLRLDHIDTPLSPFLNLPHVSESESYTPAWLWSIIRYLSARVHFFIIHSWTCMCSFINSRLPPFLLSLRNFYYYIYISVYILGQSQVSSVAAPHLRIPIIVNFNQQLVFLLINRSHLNVDSPSVGCKIRRCQEEVHLCFKFYAGVTYSLGLKIVQKLHYKHKRLAVIGKKYTYIIHIAW